jgi:hypothetical protein
VQAFAGLRGGGGGGVGTFGGALEESLAHLGAAGVMKKTNSAWAIGSGLLCRTVAADHLVGQRAGDVDPEVVPFVGGEGGAERACGERLPALFEGPGKEGNAAAKVDIDRMRSCAAKGCGRAGGRG